MPQCAAWIDDAREQFGVGVRVIYAEENGRSRGRPGEEGVVATPPMKNPEKGHGREQGRLRASRNGTESAAAGNVPAPQTLFGDA